MVAESVMAQGATDQRHEHKTKRRGPIPPNSTAMMLWFSLHIESVEPLNLTNSLVFRRFLKGVPSLQLSHSVHGQMRL